MASYDITYVDPNFPNPNGPNDVPIIIYGYTPSVAVGAVGIAIFTVALFAHGFLLIRHRTWYFIPVLIGLVMEIVGYIFRLLSGKTDPYSVLYFVLQYFMIVVAPVFFSAAIYTISSVLISLYGREYSPLPPKAILGIFITSDVVATIVQVAGAALIGTAYSSRKDPTTANHILLAGLAFQVFTFAVFLMVLGMILFKARRSPITVDRGFLGALVVATLAVYLRTCFRLAETAQGLAQNLSTHEVFFGSLEFAPIVIAVFIFTYWHPGRWLQRPATKPPASTPSRV